MKFELILAVDSGDGEITNVPLAQMTRPDVSELATLGLSLCESKQLLAQHVEVAANAFVAAECTPFASGANPSHRRPSSPGLRTMVPRLYRQRRNPPTQRLTHQIERSPGDRGRRRHAIRTSDGADVDARLRRLDALSPEKPGLHVRPLRAPGARGL